jgi:hypothetical protein
MSEKTQEGLDNLIIEGLNAEKGELDLRERELDDDDIKLIVNSDKIKGVTALFLEYNAYPIIAITTKITANPIIASFPFPTVVESDLLFMVGLAALAPRTEPAAAPTPAAAIPTFAAGFDNVFPMASKILILSPFLVFP